MVERVGDVVTVMPCPDNPTLVTHRVFGRAVCEDGSVSFTTQGDAKDAVDLWVTTATQARGVVRYHVRCAGHLAGVLDGEQEGEGPLVLDPRRLRTLGEHIGAGHAEEFAGRYCAMLPGRVRRLRLALAEGREDDAHVAALSLVSASAMVGADALAEAAGTVARATRVPGVAPARDVVAQVGVLAQLTAMALGSVLPAP